MYDEVDRHVFAMKDRAMGFEEVALTTAAIQRSPRATAGMTVGTNIAQPEPATIATVGIGTEMVGGVDLAPASSRRDDTRGRGTGRLTAGLDGLFTSVAVGLAGKTRKRFGLLGALARWRDGLGWSRP